MTDEGIECGVEVLGENPVLVPLCPPQIPQATLCDICYGQSGNGTGFSPRTSISPRQHHSTNASHPYFIHLAPMK
jgi:hypothetical protein